MWDVVVGLTPPQWTLGFHWGTKESFPQDWLTLNLATTHSQTPKAAQQTEVNLFHITYDLQLWPCLSEHLWGLNKQRSKTHLEQFLAHCRLPCHRCFLNPSLKKKIIYLFISRQRRREEEREGEKHQRVVVSHTPLTGDLAGNPGMCPVLVRLTGDQTGDPLVLRLALNPLSHIARAQIHLLYVHFQFRKLFLHIISSAIQCCGGCLMWV